MENAPDFTPSELSDKTLAQFITQLYQSSETSSALKRTYSANLIMRYFLLYKMRRVLRSGKLSHIERHYQVKLDTVNEKASKQLSLLHTQMESALSNKEYVTVASISGQIQMHQKNLADHQVQIEAEKQTTIAQVNKDKLTDEQKRQELENLVLRNIIVSKSILDCKDFLLSEANALNHIASKIAFHSAKNLKSVEELTRTRTTTPKVLPDIYQHILTYCQRVERKAKSVSHLAKEFQELMRAASHYELGKVNAMLGKNPHLVYAQGDFYEAFERAKDGQKKIYKKVTLFQYLWIIGDIKLCEAVMKYFNTPEIKEAAIQVLALDERDDIQLYTYEDTIKEYTHYLTNYSKWDYKKQCDHLVKVVGGEQYTWPGYLVTQFIATEPSNNTSWTTQNITEKCAGVTDKQKFSNWSKVINEGRAHLGGEATAAKCEYPYKLLYGGAGDADEYKYEKLQFHIAFYTDLKNLEIRHNQQKLDRNRLKSEFKQELSQESQRIASNVDRQQIKS